MNQKPQPLFLERKSYRQQRASDAAYMLPALGVVLWILFPFMRNPAATPENETAIGGLYIFGSWLFLIILTIWLARRARIPADEIPKSDEDQPQ